MRGIANVWSHNCVAVAAKELKINTRITKNSLIIFFSFNCSSCTSLLFSIRRFKKIVMFRFFHGQFQEQYLQPDANFVWAVARSSPASFFCLKKNARIKSQLRKFVFEFRKIQWIIFAFCFRLSSWSREIKTSSLVSMSNLFWTKRKNYQIQQQMLRKSRFICWTIR